MTHRQRFVRPIEKHCKSQHIAGLGNRVSPAKTVEPIKMLFCRLTHASPRNCVFDGGQNWTNPFKG